MKPLFHQNNIIIRDQLQGKKYTEPKLMEFHKVLLNNQRITEKIKEETPDTQQTVRMKTQ